MAHLTGESKRQYVAGMFARIVGRYDLMNDLMTAGLHRRWKREAAHVSSHGLQGKALDVAGVKQLASIPPKEVLLAQLCGLLMSPISRTAVVLSALAAKRGGGAEEATADAPAEAAPAAA